jgi:hypothetical protein
MAARRRSGFVSWSDIWARITEVGSQASYSNLLLYGRMLRLEGIRPRLSQDIVWPPSFSVSLNTKGSYWLDLKGLRDDTGKLWTEEATNYLALLRQPCLAQASDKMLKIGWDLERVFRSEYFYGKIWFPTKCLLCVVRCTINVALKGNGRC